jgi:D-alanyl-D-alanine dipeptidase
MLGAWRDYQSLKKPDRLDAIPVLQLDALHPEWLRTDTVPRIVSLKQLHQLKHEGKGLVLIPAYAQTEYIYDTERIIKADAAHYRRTLPAERLNQFDRLGAAYLETLDDIFIEYRLGCVVSDAAAYAAQHARVASDQGLHGEVALLVIDGLRTVDATYALAAANPEAIANKLLAMPGKSAHNKGMAVDLTLVYWSAEHACWMDADMLGHMDHPDMRTNHRNFTDISAIQRHNRLELERVMLRSAFTQNMLLAPLREEFWDFRFPEDGLDFWRVLESVARVTENIEAKNICAEAISHIHQLLREGKRAEAYDAYEMTMEDFMRVWEECFSDTKSQEKIQATLGISAENLGTIQAIMHGNVNVLYDSDLPSEMKQTNPTLKYLFE